MQVCHRYQSTIIEKNQAGNSHAWICDGYRIASHRVDYFIMSPLGQPTDIQYGYECVGQWDQNGNSNYQFQNSTHNMYFSPFANDSAWWWYDEPVHYYHDFKPKKKE